jgi:hypothetical protein
MPFSTPAITCALIQDINLHIASSSKSDYCSCDINKYCIEIHIRTLSMNMRKLVQVITLLLIFKRCPVGIMFGKIIDPSGAFHGFAVSLGKGLDYLKLD